MAVHMVQFQSKEAQSTTLLQEESGKNPGGKLSWNDCTNTFTDKMQ
jgi:hypothetical protein